MTDGRQDPAAALPAASEAALARLATALAEPAGPVVAVTGAGASVASGVPDFRSDAGLWQRYDPVASASVEALRADPARVWELLWELDELLRHAEPNPAHHALAALEEAGAVSAVLTQNPDGLHHRAGSQRVVELHGTATTLSCLACGAELARGEVAAAPPSVPRCTCGGVLRPDVTLFGEPPPEEALAAATDWCSRASELLVIGTALEVLPVAQLPDLAQDAGARVWEINVRPVHGLDPDERITAPAEVVLPRVAEHVLGQRARSG